jgi:hypothetical protein
VASFSATGGNPASGTLSWTPTVADLGSRTVSFTATDDNPTPCATTTHVVIVVQCSPSDAAPAFTAPGCGGTVAAQAGTAVTFTVSAGDQDAGDRVTLAKSGGPGSLAVVTSGNPASSRFSWTPTAADTGDRAVSLTATDACGAVSNCGVTLHVSPGPPPQACPVFDAPTLADRATVTAPMGQAMTIHVAAHDVNAGQVVTLFAPDKPAAASFSATGGNPVIGTLTWTPTTADLGSHTVTFDATDDNLSPCTAATHVVIVVGCSQSDAAPTFTAPACGSTLEAQVGQAVTFAVSAQDPDASDQVTLSMSGQGALSRVPGNPATARFGWTPAPGDTGDQVVTFNATDGCGAASSCAVTIHVAGASGESASCDQARALVEEIWPPNHKFVPVTIVGPITAEGTAMAVEVTECTQDEPLSSCTDALMQGGQASVLAERSESGNGRVYELTFTARDGRGGTCHGRVQVCVPHDRGHGRACADDGQRFNSIGGCGGPSQLLSRAAPDALGLLDGLALRIGESGGQVTLEYALPSDGLATLSLYDIAGRWVATLDRSYRTAGAHQLTWNADHLGRGIYFCRLSAGDRSVTRTLLHVR